MNKRVEESGVERATKSVAVQGPECSAGPVSPADAVLDPVGAAVDAVLDDDVVFDEDGVDEADDPLVITEPVTIVSEDIVASTVMASVDTKSSDGENPAEQVYEQYVAPGRGKRKARERSEHSERGMKRLCDRLKTMSEVVQSRVRTVPEKDKGPPREKECGKDKNSGSRILQDLKSKIESGSTLIRCKFRGITGSKGSKVSKEVATASTNTSAVKMSNLPVVIICISIAACLILASLGLYVLKTLTLTKENYESEMHKVFSELIDARAATSNSFSGVVIGESGSSDISEVSSSGMTSSTEESRVYKRGMDKLDLLSRLTSVASMDVAIEERYLIPVTWNNLTIFIPSDMRKYEVSFEPLTVSVDSSDVSLRLDLVELNKSPEEVVEDEFAEFQRSPSVSESVIELSKSEENRSFLQVTYKSALATTSNGDGESGMDSALEDTSLDTESQLELSRNMYIAVLRVTAGVGLRCVYDAGTNAKVESQNVLYEALVANVADRFV